MIHIGVRQTPKQLCKTIILQLNKKESTGKAGDAGNYGFDSWVGKIPWRRAWQPTPVVLPGEPHGQRGLEGYSPWGHKESDTTEATFHAHMYIVIDKVKY